MRRCDMFQAAIADALSGVRNVKNFFLSLSWPSNTVYLHVNIDSPIQYNSHTKVDSITRGTAKLGACLCTARNRGLRATRAPHSQSSLAHIRKARFPRPPRMMSSGAYLCGLGLGFAISYTSMMYAEMARGKVCK